MPEYFTIWGFARSKMSNEEFREYIGTSLSCRLTDKGNCAEKFDAFLERCFYHPGQYSNRDDFAALSEKMKEPEKVPFAQNYVTICTIPMIFLLSHGYYVATVPVTCYSGFFNTQYVEYVLTHGLTAHDVMLCSNARLQTGCFTSPSLLASSPKWQHVPQMQPPAREHPIPTLHPPCTCVALVAATWCRPATCPRQLLLSS